MKSGIYNIWIEIRITAIYKTKENSSLVYIFGQKKKKKKKKGYFWKHMVCMLQDSILVMSVTETFH